MSIRVTFALDESTVASLRRTAARLRKPQSLVVREAVAEYAARADELTDGERARALAALARIRDAESTRSAGAVDEELRQLRAARRRGGRGGR
jgi:predicted transcriptional regulator